MKDLFRDSCHPVLGWLPMGPKISWRLPRRFGEISRSVAGLPCGRIEKVHYSTHQVSRKTRGRLKQAGVGSKPENTHQGRSRHVKRQVLQVPISLHVGFFPIRAAFPG
jgi:hypothetical protein